MKKLNSLIWKLRIAKDTRGQDLIEYALMVGFIAVAAGAVVPGIVTNIRAIFTAIESALSNSMNAGN